MKYYLSTVLLISNSCLSKISFSCRCSLFFRSALFLPSYAVSNDLHLLMSEPQVVRVVLTRCLILASAALQRNRQNNTPDRLTPVQSNDVLLLLMHSL